MIKYIKRINFFHCNEWDIIELISCFEKFRTGNNPVVTTP